MADKQATAMWAMVATFGKQEDLQAVFARLRQQPSLTTADRLVLLDAPKLQPVSETCVQPVI